MNKLTQLTGALLIGAAAYMPCAHAAEPIKTSGLESKVAILKDHTRNVTISRADVAKLWIQYQLLKGMRNYTDEKIAYCRSNKKDPIAYVQQRRLIERAQDEIINIVSYSKIEDAPTKK